MKFIPSDRGEVLVVDDGRPNLGQLAFREGRKLVVSQLGNRLPQDRIAQELKSLVGILSEPLLDGGVVRSRIP